MAKTHNALKTALLPVTFVLGTLEGATKGVAETVGAVGSTVLKTGTEGATETWAMWKKSDLPSAAKVAATPFVFVFGTVKGLVGGVQGVVMAVGSTAVGTLTGGVKACVDGSNPVRSDGEGS